MKLVFTEECLNYKMPGHPESPERVKEAYEHLKDSYETVGPKAAEEKDLLLVHEPRQVEMVTKGSFQVPDNPVYENLFYYASLSVGGALKAQEIQGLSLMRPPGHHAGKDSMGGFCYFNNLAVAVKKSGLKTLIVDIDGHHGDGTEDIFLGDDQVVYVSLHRTGIFPGTGLDSYLNVYNYPLSAYCGDEKYLETLQKALEEALSGDLEQLAVSAGFDAHIDDPLASLGLTTPAYREIGRMLADLNLPTFAVLEGGYVGEDLGKNIKSFLEGLKSKGKEV